MKKIALLICVMALLMSCSSKKGPGLYTRKKVEFITDETFHQAVLQENKLVVVDFWASWCSPCIQMDPVMEDLATYFGDEVKIVKINTEKDQIEQINYEVTGLPSILFFKNGKQVGKQIGLTTREHLRYKIKQLKDL